MNIFWPDKAIFQTGNANERVKLRTQLLFVVTAGAASFFYLLFCPLSVFNGMVCAKTLYVIGVQTNET